MGRPEILNRIGENIVVFDFIREESARAILDSQLKNIVANLKQDRNLDVVIDDCVREKLFAKAKTNLVNGGRGIGNVVEEMFINPLARYIFDEQCTRNIKLFVKDIDTEQMPVRLQIER